MKVTLPVRGTVGYIVLNLDTGKTIEFLVKKKDKTLWYLRTKDEPNNPKEAEYCTSYRGILYIRKGHAIFKTKDKAFNNENLDYTTKLGTFFTKLVNFQRLYPRLRISKANRCRVCGKHLTTPESIKAGIGPTCAQY